MSKRVKFFGVALFLGTLMWLSTWINVDKRGFVVWGLGLVAYVLSAWVLFEDLKGWEWITLMILPVLFTLSCGLFFNLLPPAIPRVFGFSFQIESAIFLAGLLRFVFSFLYVLGLYTILLTENIFSVASIRTIQLFRAARSWSFIMQLVTATMFYVIMFSLKLPFYYLFFGTGLISGLLAFGGFWSIDLKTEHLSEVYRMSILVTWIMALYATALAFWPVKPFMGGLALTGCLYASLGILEQRLLNKMTSAGQLEFVIFNLIVILTAYFSTTWRG